MDSTTDHARRDSRRAWMAVAILLLAHAVSLRAMGRIWWCKCGRWTPFSNGGEHNSQHLFDWYSPSHLLHGVIFFWLLAAILRHAARPTRLLIATAIEITWEIVENTPWIIDRYRAQTTADSYYGDSIANSFSDVACCLFGFWLARRIGLAWSIALFISLELLTLWIIRDNLTLNVIMLLMPIDPIRHWQAAK